MKRYEVRSYIPEKQWKVATVPDAIHSVNRTEALQQ
jgi:hypothetical protein